MKFVALLALAGLASCSTTLIGGDRATDVSLKYSYLDEFGRVVDVELEADKLGLGLRAPTPKAAPAPTPAPGPVLLKSAPVVAQNVVPLRYVQLQASPVPVAPQTRYIYVAAEAPEPVVVTSIYTRYVQVPVTKYVQMAAPAPKSKVVTKYVKIDYDDDDLDDSPVAPLKAAPKVVKRVQVSDDDDDSSEK